MSRKQTEAVVLCRLGRAITLTGCFVLTASGNSAWGQIASDSTLGSESSRIKSSIPGVFLIDGGATRGTNLFHSFSEFSVPTNGIAHFNNTPNIQNIISRVTGEAVSNIDGLIRANGPANLFLLNPKGIIFGPNARLAVQGSLMATTANSLMFDNSFEFSAKNPQAPPQLTINVPIGLQFGGNSGRILVQGNGQGLGTTNPFGSTGGLGVLPNQTLALVGGDIALEGGMLKTAGGRIELGSVADSSFVSVIPTDKGWTLGYQGVSTFNDIQLSGAAAVDVSGSPSGNVNVWGRRVTLQNGSRIAAITQGPKAGGTIAVNTSESVEIIGTGTFVQDFLLISSGTFSPSDLRNGIFTLTLGSGPAGDVAINTPKFITRNGAFVVTSTFGQGQGGNLTVNAESVELSASALLTATGPKSVGAAGNLTINTGRLIAQDNGFATTSSLGQGKGGTLTVRASESVELIGTDAFIVQQDRGLNTGLYTTSLGTGDAGDLQVETGRLSVRDGAAVSAGTGGKGQGGNVTVTASEFVELSGSSPNRVDNSIVAAVTGVESATPGGNVTITTGKLIVQNRAGVLVSGLGEGDAGNLEIFAGSIHLDRGRVLAFSVSGKGGNINLQTQDLISMQQNSLISAQANNNGNGGNITINAPFIVAVPKENSDIIANAFRGQGGNINITAQGIYGLKYRPQLTTLSDINATSEFGINGVVTINTPDVDPSRGLVNLPAEPVSVEVVQGCQAAGKQTAVGFFNIGRGGLASNPYEPISSSSIWEDVPSSIQGTVNSADAVRAAATPTTSAGKIVEAQGWIVNRKGKIVLVAEIPTTDAQSHCRLH